MADAGMTIGTLARDAGVNIETIRYYQKRGLLQEPPKPREGYRRYPRNSVDRVRFIKRAQKLGFTLEEIIVLLKLGDENCAETQKLAAQKLQLIEARLADLEKMRKTLTDLVSQCGQDSKKIGCPIVASLASSDWSD